MKRLFVLLTVIGLAVVFVYFKYNKHMSVAANQSSSLNITDNDDGIRAAE